MEWTWRAVLSSSNGSAPVCNNNATSSEDDSCTHNMSDNLFGQTSNQRPPLLETHYFTAVAYIGLTCAITVLGTFGNIVLLIVKLTDNNMNKYGTMFMVNSAISDLCISAVAEPVCVIGAIKGENWFNQYWFACEVVAMLCFTACVCSFLSFILFTINRYIYTCHNESYYNIFNKRRCFITCFLTWSVSFAFDSANLLGWSDHYFDRKSHRCMWSRLESKSFTMLTPIVLLGLFPPLSFLFFLSFRKIYKTKKRLYGYDKSNPVRNSTSLRDSLRSSKALLVTYLIMVICWLPAGLLYGIDFLDTVGMESYLFLTLLAHVHSCSNFIIYFSMIPGFRRSVVDLFLGRLRKKKKYQNVLCNGQTTSRLHKCSEKADCPERISDIGNTDEKSQRPEESVQNTQQGGLNCHLQKRRVTRQQRWLYVPLRFLFLLRSMLLIPRHLNTPSDNVSCPLCVRGNLEHFEVCQHTKQLPIKVATDGAIAQCLQFWQIRWKREGRKSGTVSPSIPPVCEGIG